MTPRARTAIALAGAVALNGLILGALGLGRGPARQAFTHPGGVTPTIWLSLEPGATFPIGKRVTGAEDGDEALTGAAPFPPALPIDPWPTPGSSEQVADTAGGTPEMATTVTSSDIRDRIARSLRTRLGCSPDRDDLSAVERNRCEARMLRGSAAIAGSGNARLDRRFERQGARQLAAYEARRQRQGGAVRPRCEDAGPVSDCGVDVSIEIFSSVDGFFPGLRPDDDD